jgi:hypothetical protein
MPYQKPSSCCRSGPRSTADAFQYISHQRRCSAVAAARVAEPGAAAAAAAVVVAAITELPAGTSREVATASTTVVVTPALSVTVVLISTDPSRSSTGVPIFTAAAPPTETAVDTSMTGTGGTAVRQVQFAAAEMSCPLGWSVHVCPAG